MSSPIRISAIWARCSASTDFFSEASARVFHPASSSSSAVGAWRAVAATCASCSLVWTRPSSSWSCVTRVVARSLSAASRALTRSSSPSSARCAASDSPSSSCIRWNSSTESVGTAFGSRVPTNPAPSLAARRAGNAANEPITMNTNIRAPRRTDPRRTASQGVAAASSTGV